MRNSAVRSSSDSVRRKGTRSCSGASESSVRLLRSRGGRLSASSTVASRPASRPARRARKSATRNTGAPSTFSSVSSWLDASLLISPARRRSCRSLANCLTRANRALFILPSRESQLSHTYCSVHLRSGRVPPLKPSTRAPSPLNRSGGGAAGDARPRRTGDAANARQRSLVERQGAPSRTLRTATSNPAAPPDEAVSRR
mmetsp:Transcript_14447/g.50249  ORF Transcript_14447/g.50249 Transcript_14447/m.50249 type:complete len:200 (-) Transcript_14447:13-612(-)